MIKHTLIAILLVLGAHSLCNINGVLEAGEQCDPLLPIPCTSTCVRTCGDSLNSTREDCDPSAGYTGAIPCSADCLYCGNGQVDPGEGQACDRSDPAYDPAVDGACDNFCQNPCGNGVVENIFGEQCEGNDLICDGNCRFRCGNGVRDVAAGPLGTITEDCDYSDPADPNAATCLDDCTLCGDGVVNGAEVCDPTSGGTIPCYDNCQPSCGFDRNGVASSSVDRYLGEECDGLLPYGQPCDPSTCVLSCGNGNIDAWEICDPSDPANVIAGCDPTFCTNPAAACGNGLLDIGEFCDPSVPLNNIPCDPTCIPTCGNAVINGAPVVPVEACDPNDAIADNCDPVTCQLIAPAPPACGNGILDAGEACDDGNAINNDLCDNNCQATTIAVTCGNGVLDLSTGEQCEPSLQPFCSATCTITLPLCGNRVLDSPEQCDDGNNVNGDGCTGYCFVEDGYYCESGLYCSKCGNFRIDVDEGQTCDDGNRLNGDGCNSRCQVQFSEFCGNGILETGEQCDDGNNINFDGCNRYCRTEVGFFCYPTFNGTSLCSLCGNGIIDSGELCDDGRNDAGDGCYQCRVEKNWLCEGAPSVCNLKPALFCGDGIYSPEIGEQCDDGDQINWNGCSRACKFSLGYRCDSEPGQLSVCYLIETNGARCGNGILELGEECDDGNVVSADGCNSTCRVQKDLGFNCTFVIGELSVCTKYVSCGNGIHEPEYNQACDDGNSIAGDGCFNCLIQTGWNCDEYGASLKSVCFVKDTSGGDGGSGGSGGSGGDGGSTQNPVCGNANREEGEICDDGNRLNGDGCNSLCQQEQFFTCTTTLGRRSFCRQYYFPPVCGNSNLEDGESCDDGNTNSGDGCSNKCQVEAGYHCPFVGQSCRKFCGNGIVETEHNEQCDDADQENGDGCNSNCQVEDGYYCFVQNGFTFSICRITCGNSQLEKSFGQQCDDGNQANGDGCNSTCQVEDGWGCSDYDFELSYCSPSNTCGDGIYEPEKGEQCDDKNQYEGDGCSSRCTVDRTGKFNCFSTPGLQTYCEIADLCPSGRPVRSDLLSPDAQAALGQTPFAGFTTVAEVVTGLIIGTPGNQTKNVILTQQLSTVFSVFGLVQEWNYIDHEVDLCLFRIV